jgi:methenyltetrahydromethanopterin cyclohydrolase
MTLNDRAWRLADELEAHEDDLRVAASTVGGCRVIDCGAAVPGSLGAGVLLARACLADRGTVSLVPGEFGPAVQVVTDDPVRACLASQYAGMQVKVEKYFAMGSGPMRAAAAREELFHHLPGKESPSCAVGVLETKTLPTADVVAHLVGKLPTTVERLTLLVAPAASLAGTLQVVARSVETALHKLHELKFDVTRVVSGYGVAPLPPVAKDEIGAIGRTNDAILYGGRVTLWVTGDDESIETVGPKVPSNASPDHGAPFAEIFKRAGGDFYKIDPMLFSPAQIRLTSVGSGRSFEAGRVDLAVLERSFWG